MKITTYGSKHIDRCTRIKTQKSWRMNCFSCRRSEEFAPKMICLRLKPGRKLPHQESGNPEKTITCRGDLFTRRQSVAGKLKPEKSFLCNFLRTSKANKMTPQKPANDCRCSVPQLAFAAAPRHDRCAGKAGSCNAPQSVQSPSWRDGQSGRLAPSFE